jgi:hypothetical protein
MRPSLCVAIVVVLTATLMAQTSGTQAKKAPASRSWEMAKDIQVLRKTVAAQQQMEAQRERQCSPGSTGGGYLQACMGTVTNSWIAFAIPSFGLTQKNGSRGFPVLPSP